MSSNIKFWLNGQEYVSNKIISLSNLIDYFDYIDKLLVIEHNNLVCNKTAWAKVLILDLDKIEIVTIVGGG